MELESFLTLSIGRGNFEFMKEFAEFSLVEIDKISGLSFKLTKVSTVLIGTGNAETVFF